jgi:glycosyltransferase involved in cell wall biosynthesis
MKFIFLSYVSTREFRRPEDWIKRIGGYYGVLEALSRRHTVISIEQIGYEGRHNFNGVTSYFFNHSRHGLRFPFRLHRFVRRLAPDIVVVHGLHFPAQVILLRLALGRRVYILVQSHADKPPRGLKKVLQKWADRGTNAYLFTSKVMAGEWIDAGLIRSEDKIRELMVASSVLKKIGREDALARTGVRGDPVFVWAGRLDENKDPFTLITAFLNFASDLPQARLYMIYQGDELLPQVYAQLAKSPYRDAVVLVGKVAHEEMAWWFSAADFVVSTSHAEAFGLAVAEAMSCGCIPIVTDIPSYRKITADGNCGLLFGTGDPVDLLRAMSRAILMDQRQQQKKVALHFAENLSFTAIAGQLDRIGVSL